MNEERIASGAPRRRPEPARRGFAESYRDFVANTDPADRAFDMDEPFESVRDATPGREVEL